MRAYDLIVIGGGLVGGAVAWGAARLGASVALLDEGDVAFRAARGNFGLVWVQSKGAGMPPYAHWTRRSAELWPELAGSLAEATGVDVALRQNGGLAFCFSEAEYQAREALIARMHNESGGIGTRMIGRAELRAMVPGIGDGVVGAAFCPVDGHANPLKLLRSLQSGLAGLGGPPPPVVAVLPPALIALLFIVAGMVRDWRVLGKVHPAYLWAGGFALSVLVVRNPLGDTPLWHGFARSLIALAG